MWSSLLLIFVVCSVVHRNALGVGGRGCPDYRGDGRRHLVRVALLRAGQTKPASHQS